jgi:hypothetical protein
MYEPAELESDLAVAGLVPAMDDTSLYLMHYVGTKPRHRRHPPPPAARGDSATPPV